MKIGIIGAGYTGLAAGYKLTSEGHDVLIYEKDPQPGGLAIGYREKNWEWSLEKHYHHWFTNDESVLSLAKKINHEVVIKRPVTSSYVDSQILQLDSPITLLKFAKLSQVERVRMAATLAALRFNPFWKPLEKLNADKVLPSLMGKKSYEMLWEPLLSNKFGKYSKDISLAWFWARIKKRTTSLAYPSGGFLDFATNLTDKIIENGGVVNFSNGVVNIKADKNKVILRDEKNNTDIFDKVLVTLPSHYFTQITNGLPQGYKNKLTNLKGIGAVNLVVRLSKPFFSSNTYWLSICEKNAPLLAVVEHTNFMNRKYYNNEHIVYLGNYLPTDHRYFKMGEREIFSEMKSYLNNISPNFHKNIIGIKKFVAPFAQPVIPVNYSKQIPPFMTPVKNVYLANMQQVYPWDRGTNYAVELGERVSSLIT